MPNNAYEEVRDSNIRSNIATMKSYGILDTKTLLNQLSTRKQNGYRIVARKKNNCE